MTQSISILRYLGAKYAGEDGEHLYPGRANADLSYLIDARIDLNGDMEASYAVFLYPMNPEYEKRDKHFTNWITKIFPAFCE